MSLRIRVVAVDVAVRVCVGDGFFILSRPFSLLGNSSVISDFQRSLCTLFPMPQFLPLLGLFRPMRSLVPSSLYWHLVCWLSAAAVEARRAEVLRNIKHPLDYAYAVMPQIQVPTNAAVCFLFGCFHTFTAEV